MALHSFGLYTFAAEAKPRHLPNPKKSWEKKDEDNSLNQLRTSMNLNLFTAQLL